MMVRNTIKEKTTASTEITISSLVMMPQDAFDVALARAERRHPELHVD